VAWSSPPPNARHGSPAALQALWSQVNRELAQELAKGSIEQRSNPLAFLSIGAAAGTVAARPPARTSSAPAPSHCRSEGHQRRSRRRKMSRRRLPSLPTRRREERRGR